MDASKLRQRAGYLCRERQKLERIILAGREPLLKGSIVKAYLRCARPECRCQKDKKARHGPYLYLHYTQDGEQKMVYIRAEVELKVKKWTESYQRLRRARARIVKINLEILKLIDRLEKARRKELSKDD